MKNRYKRMILKNVFLAINLHFKSRKLRKQNKLTFDEKYAYIMKFIKIYHRDMDVKVNTFGLENIDKDIKGCAFMGNHQGKADGAATLVALSECPTSFIIADTKSHQFMFGNVCDLLGVKRIKFDDLKSQLKVYNEMTEEIKEGQKYIIFPEAGYADNKNNLREFNTPCFAPVIKSKCPIIPFCLYDTWKVYHEDYQGKDILNVEVHFLKPIYYEEYGSLNKKALAELVKERISEKLEQIKREKNEV